MVEPPVTALGFEPVDGVPAGVIAAVTGEVVVEAGPTIEVMMDLLQTRMSTPLPRPPSRP
jgi:hypothetical protein